MGNIITIPIGTAAQAPCRHRGARPTPAQARKQAQQPDRTTLRRNVTTESKPAPCPDVREIMRENARLRADNAIYANRLKVYEMRFGALS